MLVSLQFLGRERWVLTSQPLQVPLLPLEHGDEPVLGSQSEASLEALQAGSSVASSPLC